MCFNLYLRRSTLTRHQHISAAQILTHAQTARTFHYIYLHLFALAFIIVLIISVKNKLKEKLLYEKNKIWQVMINEVNKLS